MRTTIRMIIERDVAIPMRDGTILYADLYRPEGDERYPVLLQRTPYNKENIMQSLTQTDTLRAVMQGYVVVIQDVRGRYRSEGAFTPFLQEIDDGYDTVEWCATQAWANGKVGMYGTSYVGAVQWLAAIAQPPHLTCIVPTFTASDYYEGWTYQGGAFQWGFMVNWVLPYLTSADLVRRHDLEPLPDFEQRRQEIVRLVDNMPQTAVTWPLSELPVDRELSPYFWEWMAHPTRDKFWRAVSIEERHDRIQVPALNVGGWYDIFLDGTLRNFAGVRERGATDDARSGARLLLGPWTHTTPPLSIAGAHEFGLMAGQGLTPIGMNVDTEHLRFFNYWLKGIDDGLAAEPPVRIFVMGEDVWREEESWPLERAQLTDYYLHSGGNANSAAGDGVLSAEPPGDERPDVYLYDPYHPVPTHGGQTCCFPTRLPSGIYDQRAVESRSDVLVFMTPPLEADVEVTGPITLHLWAATTAPDTDFTGKLVDVFPDGYTRNLTDGIIRARYREGTDRARPITPGEVIEYRIDLWATANLFRAGHRIGLEVSSSNFPRFDRNPNTGEELGEAAELRPALQTIHHDREHPSRLVLPIIPR